MRVRTSVAIGMGVSGVVIAATVIISGVGSHGSESVRLASVGDISAGSGGQSAGNEALKPNSGSAIQRKDVNAKENRDESSPRVVFPAPSLAHWRSVPAEYRDVTKLLARERQAAPRQALARYYRTDIYKAARTPRRGLGYARRGMRLPVTDLVNGTGCKGGSWYLVYGGGYACTRAGFTVGAKPSPLTLHYRLPDISRPIPYHYVELTNVGAPRLYRLPTPEEERAIERGLETDGALPEVVERRMEGVFFLAIDTSFSEEPAFSERNGKYLRTVYGRYVRAKDVKRLPPSTMHGVVLDNAQYLPVAFVYGEDRPVFRLSDGELEAVGIAKKHARMRVKRVIKRAGKKYIESPKGFVLRRNAVRIARKVRRPARIVPKKRWVHVDLSEQTLVAYEGTRPVFATVVSSGKEGHVPPKGVFRVVKKHVTVTMNGDDPIDKWYEVEEVPWTQYYWEGYALHGAYWHNDFGRPKSHGCTNLAPADARWLFYWTKPELPAGWHGILREGTWVSFTS